MLLRIYFYELRSVSLDFDIDFPRVLINVCESGFREEKSRPSRPLDVHNTNTIQNPPKNKQDFTELSPMPVSKVAVSSRLPEPSISSPVIRPGPVSDWHSSEQSLLADPPPQQAKMRNIPLLPLHKVTMDSEGSPPKTAAHQVPKSRKEYLEPPRQHTSSRGKRLDFRALHSPFSSSHTG